MKQKLIITAFSLTIVFSCSQPEQKTEVVTKINDEIELVKSPPEWSKNSTIYEVNLRQYSHEGTIEAFRNDLGRIKELGIDILWFMPIHPIGEKNRKGTEGSYYSVKDYKQIHSDYGTIEDFKSLVSEAHKLGMHVILDWVANHTAFDNIWIEQGHDDWYTPDSNGNIQPPIGTDWWDVADLDYDNFEMRSAMIEAMKFWVTECDIDGYRCDVADWVPVDFWNEARRALDSIKPVFMLAEAENPELHEKAFDMSYGWEFHFIMNDVAQGNKSVKHIRDYLKGNAKRFEKDAYRLHFTSNHDENSWKGTVEERLGKSKKAFAVLAATIEGMPLIYNGQEGGLNKRLEFFEKDTIEWGDWSMSDFYTPLLNLNKENEALWNGNFGGDIRLLNPEKDTINLAYSREKGNSGVICLFNFSNQNSTVRIDFSGLSGRYTELYEKDTLNLNDSLIALQPWEFKLYHK